MITNIYKYTLDGSEYLKFVKDVNPETGQERILFPHELKNPFDVEIGDEEAYKVLLSFEYQEKPYIEPS